MGKKSENLSGIAERNTAEQTAETAADERTNVVGHQLGGQRNQAICEYSPSRKRSESGKK